MENTVIEKIKKGDILILNDDPDLILEIVKYISKIELIEEKAWKDMAQENKGYYLSWRDGFNRPWSWVSEAFRDKGKLFITTLDALDYIRKITTRLE